MDYLRSFVVVVVVVAVVAAAVAAEAAVLALQHPNRQLLLMVEMVAHHGNFHADLAHNRIVVADCLVAKHDNVAVVDNFDFPVIFN